jgi:sialidase-1
MMTRDNPLRHAVLTYTSEDQGKTWIRSNIVDLGGAGNHGGLTEATLEELTDGRLMKLIRTNWGEFWRAESKDNGRYWHPMGPSGIPASSTPGILKRLESGRLMLIWNQPKPEGAESYRMVGGDNIWSSVPTSNHRSELSLAFSEDDGKTWSDPVIIARIETGGYRGRHRYMPNHEISYPLVFEASPGEIWVTSWRGPLRAKFHEKDFVGDNRQAGR